MTIDMIIKITPYPTLPTIAEDSHNIIQGSNANII